MILIPQWKQQLQTTDGSHCFIFEDGTKLFWYRNSNRPILRVRGNSFLSTKAKEFTAALDNVFKGNENQFKNLLNNSFPARSCPPAVQDMELLEIKKIGSQTIYKFSQNDTI